jgi:hypothetical protein
VTLLYRELSGCSVASTVKIEGYEGFQDVHPVQTDRCARLRGAVPASRIQDRMPFPYVMQFSSFRVNRSSSRTSAGVNKRFNLEV